MLENPGFWLRYAVAMVLLIVVARAFWLAALDEREARLWSERREALRALAKLEKERLGLDELW